jgi:hypothetical protein
MESRYHFKNGAFPKSQMSREENINQMEYTIILIALLVVVVTFFILREFNYRYSKINERISRMEEQNNLLWTLILGANPNEVIKKEISLVSQAENPKVKKRNVEKPKLPFLGIKGVTDEFFKNVNL